MTDCKWCRGSGGISVDGGSLAYRCPNCDGSGKENPQEEECKSCGEWKETDGDCEYCEEMEPMNTHEQNEFYSP
jgi:DnaJ-class molecular chaperone